MARQFIYHMQGLSKSYPGNRKVLENIHLQFYPDAKIGVLGVNGSGKSTLLRIMAGIDTDYNGEAWVAEGARVGYLQQEPELDADKTVRENVMEGVAPQKAIVDRYNELAVNYSDETADEMTKLQDEIEAKGLWDLDSKVDLAMEALRCPPDDGEVTKLSGGERRRVALCKLLLEQPELLLLDEPTNHLDAESVHWLEGHLRNYPGAILIVTHDRYFLDNVTSWILELDRGKGIPYEGNYTAWLSQKRKRLEQEGREEAAHQRTLAREQEWIAASPRARQAKSKARYNAYEELVKKAAEKQTQTAQIVIPVAERLGQNVVDFEGLTKAFGDNLLIDDLTFKLPPGGIVGIIGPNGAGKTTVFNCLTGFYKPTVGRLCLEPVDGPSHLLEQMEGFRIAQTARVARTFQNIRLFPGMTALENLVVAQHNVLMAASGFTIAGLIGLSGFRNAERAAIDAVVEFFMDPTVGMTDRLNWRAMALRHGIFYQGGYPLAVMTASELNVGGHLAHLRGGTGPAAIVPGM